MSKLLSWKTINTQISLICVLNHFLIHDIHLRFRMYLKEMLLLSCRSWLVLRFKFERSFNNFLLINWRLLISKSFLRHLLESKAFQDKLPKMLLSGLVFKYKCGGCNTTYNGKNKRHFKTQISQHLGSSHLTGKKAKIYNNKLTAIQEYLLSCNYSSSFEYFSILTRESNFFKLKIMESLPIASVSQLLAKRIPHCL